MDVMIDLETFSTTPTASIVQIGAVMFEARSGGRLLNGKGFNRFVRVSPYNGEVDHDTMDFWLGQVAANPAHPIVKGWGKADPLDQVLMALVLWPGDVFEGMTWGSVETVWAKPSNFDLPILQSAFARCGLPVPWDHGSTRCARTLFHATGHGRSGPAVDRTGLVGHDALDDAIGQAMQVQTALGMR